MTATAKKCVNQYKDWLARAGLRDKYETEGLDPLYGLMNDGLMTAEDLDGAGQMLVHNEKYLVENTLKQDFFDAYPETHPSSQFDWRLLPMKE